ncbi:MAG: hypothetical protein HYV63_31665 [Candidatus Schekmanbacteria bacterium]|nr:hypothetical protein [Candidatus Schekmanbacteria bacterium]
MKISPGENRGASLQTYVDVLRAEAERPCGGAASTPPATVADRFEDAALPHGRGPGQAPARVLDMENPLGQTPALGGLSPRADSATTARHAEANQDGDHLIGAATFAKLRAVTEGVLTGPQPLVSGHVSWETTSDAPLHPLAAHILVELTSTRTALVRRTVAPSLTATGRAAEARAELSLGDSLSAALPPLPTAAALSRALACAPGASTSDVLPIDDRGNKHDGEKFVVYPDGRMEPYDEERHRDIDALHHTNGINTDLDGPEPDDGAIGEARMIARREQKPVILTYNATSPYDEDRGAGPLSIDVGDVLQSIADIYDPLQLRAVATGGRLGNKAVLAQADNMVDASRKDEGTTFIGYSHGGGVMHSAAWVASCRIFGEEWAMSYSAHGDPVRATIEAQQHSEQRMSKIRVVTVGGAPGSPVGPALMAVSGGAAVGAVFGGTTGALVGGAVAGPGGALAGGAVGATTGAAAGGAAGGLVAAPFVAGGLFGAAWPPGTRHEHITNTRDPVPGLFGYNAFLLDPREAIREETGHDVALLPENERVHVVADDSNPHDIHSTYQNRLADEA